MGACVERFRPLRVARLALRTDQDLFAPNHPSGPRRLAFDRVCLDPTAAIAGHGPSIAYAGSGRRDRRDGGVGSARPQGTALGERVGPDVAWADWSAT